jgi:hypothetical protein
MEPYRAFIADKLPPQQLAKGFLAQSFFTGFGITLANVSHQHAGDPAEPRGAGGAARQEGWPATALHEIWEAIVEMPGELRKLALVNMRIVIPMLIQTVTFGAIFKDLLGDDPNNAITFAAILLACAAAAMMWIKEPRIVRDVDDVLAMPMGGGH